MPTNQLDEYDEPMAEQPTEDEAVEAEEKKEAQESAAPALLPRQALKGRDVKVGDTIKLRVDRVMDGEVAVSCMGGESDDDLYD